MKPSPASGRTAAAFAQASMKRSIAAEPTQWTPSPAPVSAAQTAYSFSPAVEVVWWPR